MIIAAFRAFGRETVIEFNPAADWKSWEFYKDGKDTHHFLGKIEIITTNYWKQSARFTTNIMLLGLIIAAAVSAEALDLASITLEQGGQHGL